MNPASADRHNWYPAEWRVRHPSSLFDKQTCFWCQWGNAVLFQACLCLKKLKSLQSSTPLFIYLVTSFPLRNCIPRLFLVSRQPGGWIENAISFVFCFVVQLITPADIHPYGCRWYTHARLCARLITVTNVPNNVHLFTFVTPFPSTLLEYKSQ